MNKYVATVRVGSINVKTLVFAENTIHARLLLQYQFGMRCLIDNPKQVTKIEQDCKTIPEVLSHIKPQKPLTIDQAKIANLKKQKDSIAKKLSLERSKQKIFKAQQQIFKANH